MNASDIKDEQTLRTWLETRPQADSVAIATRAALRVAPLWFADEWSIQDIKKSSLHNLSILRCLLTSSVASRFSTVAIKAAASSAADVTTGLDINYAAIAAARSATAERAASAYAAQACRYSEDPDAFAVWPLVRADCVSLGRGDGLNDVPLFQSGENPLLAEWNEVRKLWDDPQGPFAFWLRWYEAALEGRSLNSDLERDIALIPDADWEKGAEHIAGLIAGLEKQHDAKDDATSLDSELAKLPAATKDQRATFAQAVSVHREHLPATLSALLEFCAAEISRLQGRNHPYDSPAEEAEAQRQIRVLTTIYATLERLKAEIPETGPLTEANIVNGEKLSRLFVRHFKEWPRKNAEDIIDSTYRAALVGLTATVGPMIGIPVNLAVGAGVVFFGGKKIVDGLKAAKDLTLP